VERLRAEYDWLAGEDGGSVRNTERIIDRRYGPIYCYGSDLGLCLEVLRGLPREVQRRDRGACVLFLHDYCGCQVEDHLLLGEHPRRLVADGGNYVRFFFL